MKKVFFATTAIMGLALAPSVATAQDTGWYVRGNLGYGAMSDMDLTGDLVGDIEAEGNLAAGLGIGYELGNKWRLEADGSTLWNDTGGISNLPGTDSDIRLSSVMLNAIYDFSDFGRWEPYVGAGIGMVQGKLSASAHDFPSAIPFGPGTGAVNVTNPACAPICNFSDKDTQFGWNLLAGLGYNVNDNLTWDTSYRYLNAGDMGFKGQRFAAPGAAGTDINTDLQDVAAHTVMTGLRYRFGGAKAMPTVAPAVVPPLPPVEPAMITCWDGSMAQTYGDCPVERTPEPVRQTYTCYDGTLVFDQANCPVPPPPPVTEVLPPVQVSICDQGDVPFVVYFEWDKSRLTSQAQAVIDQASVYTQQCGVSGVQIEGHADTSGNAAYNVGLSSRRAEVVANALSAQGVNASSITRQALGENAPAVATGDNVREPLNRRSEVLIRLVPSTGAVFQ